jgi:acyl-CoA synthetase (AMP-forming)/AMP-acid ligase II
LKEWAEKIPDRTAFQWFEKGKPKRKISYQELWCGIESVGQEIRKIAHPRELVMLLFEPGIDFYVHFFACLRVGVIAIPYYPPMAANPQKGIDLISKIIASSGCTNLVLSESINMLKSWKGKWPKTTTNGTRLLYHTISKSTVASKTSKPLPFEFPKPEDIAFLQFTSGSTSDPKGVIIGHGNFQYNLAANAFFSFPCSTKEDLISKSDRSTICSWLPQYHDMGLAVMAATTVFLGSTANLMSPLDFLVDPLVWFDVMSATKSYGSVAPNFAYGLVTRKWDSARAQKWDLSAVRALASAAEPIAYQTMENFRAKMKQDVPSFQVNDVLMPAYGMAGKFDAWIGINFF